MQAQKNIQWFMNFMGKIIDVFVDLVKTSMLTFSLTIYMSEIFHDIQDNLHGALGILFPPMTLTYSQGHRSEYL